MKAFLRQNLIWLIILIISIACVIMLGSIYFSGKSPSLSKNGDSDSSNECPGARNYSNEDKVPVYMHVSGKLNGLSQKELCFIASHTDLITLQTHYGSQTTCTFNDHLRYPCSSEELVLKMARDLKNINPNIKVLFYLSTNNKFEGYDSYTESGHEFKDEWLLRDKNGQLAHSLNKSFSAISQFDLSNADFREWWSDAVVNVMKRGPIDGVFADGGGGVLSSKWSRLEGLSDSKIAAVDAGLEAMMALTKQKMLAAGSSISPNKIVLVNGLQGGTREEFEPILTWPGVDIVMNEHFDIRQKTSKEEVLADLKDFKIAHDNGKSIILRAWPGFDWTDTEMMKKPHNELLALANERIDFPLASFLIASYPDSYFLYNWGYRDPFGLFDEYPELDKNIGKPKGAAVWNGYKATREYGCATVSIDIEKKEGKIERHTCSVQ